MKDLGNGLIGWLDPKGSFHPCNYGDHGILARKLYGITNKTIKAQDFAWNDGYINITSYNAPNSGVIGVYSRPTELQQKWLIQNLNNFDSSQLQVLYAIRKQYGF